MTASNIRSGDCLLVATSGLIHSDTVDLIGWNVQMMGDLSLFGNPKPRPPGR